MAGKPHIIDEYLAPLSDEKRAALGKLRSAIRAAAPRAEECISYGIPAFRLDGRLFVAFGAASKHCAFYPGAAPLKAFKEELSAYDTSKGTIRFPPASPLPAALVKKLVKARIAEHAAPRSPKRGSPEVSLRGRRLAMKDRGRTTPGDDLDEAPAGGRADRRSR